MCSRVLRYCLSQQSIIDEVNCTLVGVVSIQMAVCVCVCVCVCACVKKTLVLSQREKKKERKKRVKEKHPPNKKLVQCDHITCL